MKRFSLIFTQACLFSGLVFLLPSCGGQKKQGAARQEDSLFQEAKLSDIPVLLGAVRLEDAAVRTKKGQVSLLFMSRLDAREAGAFYEQEMERLGWDKAASFEGDEQFFVFAKPYSVALISVWEVKKKGTYVRVLMSAKE